VIKCRHHSSLVCKHKRCPLDNLAFTDAAIRWIITIPLKLFRDEQETDELMKRCDVALCFRGREQAIKYFENYKMSYRVCGQLVLAGKEFSRRFDAW
jgi:hypothetical protein